MQYMTERLRTPVMPHHDVIVVGGGPSGCGAALAAARAGASVLVIERQNCLGGMWTSGFVNPLFDSEDKGGIIREIIDRLDARGAWGGFRHISFRYEEMKQTLETMLREAGVEILYDTVFVGVETQDRIVKGVYAHLKEGRRYYPASQVIDATGDGLVAIAAGEEYDVGDETGNVQSMTLMFLVSGYPEKYRNADGIMFYDLMLEAYRKAGYPERVPFKKPVLIPVPGVPFAVVQMTHMRGHDPYSTASLTDATIEGRRQAIEFVETMRAYDPDFADMCLIQTAPMLGIRESARIRGRYTLTLDDLTSGRHFEDGITFVRFNIDIHHADETKQTCIIVPEYEIPLRCLQPLHHDNLLVVGRCISGTHEAMASYRVTADCCAMGEAAGKYAAGEALAKR